MGLSPDTAMRLARTLPRLGLGNVARVARYRLALKSPYSRLRKLAAETPQPPFFGRAATRPHAPYTPPPLFGAHALPAITSPPDWMADPISGNAVPDAHRPFHAIADFDARVGDIKRVWELSRFGWLVDLAERAAAGDADAVPIAEVWLRDWAETNAPYTGPNWKCGQEASLRVIALIYAQHRMGIPATPGLTALIRVHLERIAPTVSYAMAQDNNHGTSEAAALFAGGLWLEGQGVADAAEFTALGRRLLENRAARLIGEDGGFSQYSLNYHRLMLDTLCFAEWRRRAHDAPDFSQAFRARAVAATDWLHRLVMRDTGDAPVLGANDGAHILNAAGADYRDHRPSVALAAALWQDARAFPDSQTASVQLAAFGLLPTTESPLPSDAPGKATGFAVWRKGGTLAVLRHPRFRFRPNQADPLHLELWLDGRPLLIDGGTYSYNSGSDDLVYFSGVASHNTVQFDAHEPMPRLGRFLFGDWARTSDFAFDGNRMRAAYKTANGATHAREVRRVEGGFDVVDTLGGAFETATLRWRFASGRAPQLREDGVVVFDGGTLQVEGAAQIRLTEGRHSAYYLSQAPVPVLEAHLPRSAADGGGSTFTTRIRSAR